MQDLGDGEKICRIQNGEEFGRNPSKVREEVGRESGLRTTISRRIFDR